MAEKGQFLDRFSIRLALLAVVATLGLSLAAVPVLAQFGGRQGGGVFDSLFGPFSGPRYAPVERQADFTRAPPPRKLDIQPPGTVLVLGDSMADWLAYGLEDAISDNPELGVVRKHRAGSGLIRYDARNDSQDWAQAAREAIAASKPKFVVMMLGLNDRQPIRERPVTTNPGTATAAGTPPPLAIVPGATQDATDSERQPSIVAPEPQTRGGLRTYEFRTEQWAEHYSKRIDDVVAALKSAGVPVFWVGLPSIRGPRSTSEMLYLNDLYRTRAEKAGATYIDVWDGFVDENGRYVVHGPDFEGQTRRLRVSDGVHFTKAGARKLAHYVEREIRRVSARGLEVIALPSSEPQLLTPSARPGAPTPRPLAGPVLPLTVTASGADGLVGGLDPSAVINQRVVTRVLVNGESIPPAAGRSDDFKWPRRAIAPFGTDPVVATTTDPVPVMQAVPATTVAAPSGESRAVSASTTRKTTGRSQNQPQSRRNSSRSRNFDFFR